MILKSLIWVFVYICTQIIFFVLVARAIEDEEKRRRSPQRAFEPASNAESNQPINFQQLKANPKAYQKVNNDHESNLETHARPRSYEVEHQSPRSNIKWNF